MLDRDNYYATTGGHGACRGCGEVTAIRLVTSTNHAIQTKRRKEHVREMEGLIDNLNGKAADRARTTRAPRAHLARRATITLEKRLYLLESGPTGNGPASAVIANATGCSSVYASTFPFNPYNDPWVNSLFQDAPAVAKGIFEGLARRSDRRHQSAAHRAARARRRLRPSDARQVLQDLQLGGLHARRDWRCCRP